MKHEMDHERCSELLVALTRGELDAATQAEVEAHLAGCPECSAERASVEVLYSMATPEPLSEIERARLHKTVMSAARKEAPPEASPAIAFVPRESRWGARLYPVLGAAAVLVLIGTFIFFGMNGNNDNGDTPAAGGGGSEIQDSGASAGGAAPEAASLPSVWAGSLGRISDDEFQELAHQGFAQGKVSQGRSMAVEPLSTGGSTEGTTHDGAADSSGTGSVDNSAEGATVEAPGGLAGLEYQAPPRFDPQIESCVDQVTGGETSAVPVFGATGTYKGEKALILGFIVDSDRYMVWAFPVGSCDFPLDFFSTKL
jgi:anti-sigma factor RsiW